MSYKRIISIPRKIYIFFILTLIITISLDVFKIHSISVEDYLLLFYVGLIFLFFKILIKFSR